MLPRSSCPDRTNLRLIRFLDGLANSGTAISQHVRDSISREQIYREGSQVSDGARDAGQISIRLRAQALHAARGRGVPENLWAICEDCNAGKKNYFKSVDADWMKNVMAHSSVHVRLGETLKAFKGEAVPASILEFVANQDDWKKRIRELRYLGWQIETFNRAASNGVSTVARGSDRHNSAIRAGPRPAE